MKKCFKYAFLSAIALTGAVSFSACSSSDDFVDNPDYTPETNSVKTAICLSINPDAGRQQTRQADNMMIQTGSNTNPFRGIKDILFVPSTAAIGTSTSTSSKITLEDIEVFDNNSENHKIYTNKDVQVDVTNFLFIGKAKNNAAASTTGYDAQKLASGYTTNNLASAETVGAININAAAICSSIDAGSDWATKSGALATYLDGIATATDETTAWSESTNANLKNLYTQFTRTTKTAGSAAAVLLTVQDLYQKLEGLPESVADLVTAIRNAITAQTQVSGSGSEAVLAWKDNCSFKNFPTDLGLPEGCAIYVYNAETTPKYQYVTSSADNAATTAVTDFIYPNELYYLTSTPLKATSQASITWPGTVTAWTAASGSGGAWTGDLWTSDVKSTTKYIALTNNINFGTALLATTVKAGATTLYDNSKNLDPEKKGVATATNKAIDISTNSFELTGVIVGAQPSKVGWNFLPASGASWAYAVYDGTMSQTITVSTTESAPNYTMLFDNYRDGSSDATVLDVNVCLEFKNNTGESFYGSDGIILPDQKFYLVGKLNHMNGATARTFPSKDGIVDATARFWPDDQNYRAFIQDFKTTACFTLNAGTDAATSGENLGSLGKALTTVPDLRTSQQNLGLSVDLTWSTGTDFGDVILGGN